MKDLFIVPDSLKLPRVFFNAVVDEQIAHIKKTLASKGEEYAPGTDDAMHNFNVAMAIEQAQTGKPKTREDTIWDMAKKHYVSIMDMRADITLGQTQKITKAYIDEKFGDMINYLLLMKASMMQTVGRINEIIPSRISNPLQPGRQIKFMKSGKTNDEAWTAESFGLLFGDEETGIVVTSTPDGQVLQQPLKNVVLAGFRYIISPFDKEIEASPTK